MPQQHTGCGAEGEGDQAQHDDEQGAGVQEGVCTGGAAAADELWGTFSAKSAVLQYDFTGLQRERSGQIIKLPHFNF